MTPSIRCLLAGILVLGATQVWSQSDTPLAVAKRIGDKLIRDTPFRYRLVKAPLNPSFDGLHVVDFGRTFGTHQAAVAYGFTTLSATQAGPLEVQLEHNDGCKIWLNGQVVYEKKRTHDISLGFEERSVELPNRCQLLLKAGVNQLLVKSETRGGTWRVYLQPPTIKGAVLATQQTYPNIGLKAVPDVDAGVAALSNWLVVGPFANQSTQNERLGLATPYAPELGLHFGAVYDGIQGKTTWGIPKIEVLGDVIEPLEWGTNYNWNYHNGGVAWAMQQLAELSGERKYDEYATRFCDFHLQGIPFVQHQIEQLNAFNCANHHIINTPLLDFTLAPSLPFVYRLRQHGDFNNRQEYASFVERMIHYAEKEQIRLPSSNIYTRLTPEKYTTWVDDMFMGIPFLVEAAQYVTDPKRKQTLLNDAAQQVVNFGNEVWDPDANLYMHARYSARPVKLPHWSRANGWGIWATTEVLSVLPPKHPLYKNILERYRLHVASIAKWQAASGFWHNVIDRPASPEEVSGTAIFTMAIARGIRNGWLDAKTYTPVANKGWNALLTQIEPDGTVHKICMGTMCSEDENYYFKRPFFDNDTHGLFAVLFAATAMHQLQNKP